jgi:uncharacterized membrane protein YgdD (TMEM256/DUF423 family)
VDRLLYISAGVAGFLGVAMGVLAAHALKGKLAPDMLAVFDIATRYHMYHVFAICAAAWGYARWQRKIFEVAGWLFVAGIVIFCGSLYVLALTGERWLGAITPIGGLAFLAGWLSLVIGAIRASR